jgi:glycosyltransferase involved in cell wall biosynthesis
VQVLHDVIPLDHESFEGERERWQRYAPRFREAAQVIAVSKHCGDLAVELLGLDPARVTVAHHGVDPAFHPGPATAEQPYLLYVGEYDARKGYPEACEVAALVADAGLPHRLKVAGFIAPWKRAEIEGVVAASRRPDRVELLGHVHHTEELPDLMRGAAVLTVTSRYEGFGLPAAEGRACGVPVVSFRNTSLTEVVGTGGLLIDDGDTAAFAEAVIQLLRDPAAHAAVVASGLDRARSFTWEHSAALHADVLRRASKEAT